MRSNFIRIIGLILVFLPILVGIIIPFSLFSVYFGVEDTIGTIQFPNAFIEKDFNSSKPWVKYSFFIKNFNRYDLDLRVHTSIDVIYYNSSELNTSEQEIFSNYTRYFPILYKESFSVALNASHNNFNLERLYDFWNNVNESRGYSFVISVNFDGRYLNELISFQVELTKLNISDYEF